MKTHHCKIRLANYPKNPHSGTTVGTPPTDTTTELPALKFYWTDGPLVVVIAEAFSVDLIYYSSTIFQNIEYLY
jgi:hypothetical protein